MTETYGTVLADAIARAGDRPALRARGEARTHRELLASASRFAHALAASGLVPGDRVCLMVEDRVESLEAYVGVLIGGFVPVHINDRLLAPEVAAIVERAGARAFVHTDGRTPVVDQVSGMTGDGGLVVICIGEDALPGSARFADLVAVGSTVPPRVSRLPGDLAFIGFTSGTTGLPKGVAHTQQTMLRILRHMPVHWGLSPRSRCATTGTLSFVSGIWGIMLPHLYLGGEISFMGGSKPDEWVDRMVREGTQVTSVPSPLAAGFVEAVRARTELLTTLRTVIHSGSSMPAEARRQIVDLVGPGFVEAYGMTETGAPVTRTVPEDWSERCLAEDVYASAGRPVHIAEVAVLGPDGSPLSTGQTGELAVRSDTLFDGYYEQPEQTAEAMSAGWFRTGDLGRVDGAGYVYITDRLKDMVVSGGMNVFPAEVERVLVTMPGVAAAAVFGVPHERWGETVVAAVVRSDDAVTADGVIDWVRGRMASYKKPTQVRFVPQLPLNASKKIDKIALRANW